MKRNTVLWSRNELKQCDFICGTQKYFMNQNLKFYINALKLLFFFLKWVLPMELMLTSD